MRSPLLKSDQTGCNETRCHACCPVKLNRQRKRASVYLMARQPLRTVHAGNGQHADQDRIQEEGSGDLSPTLHASRCTGGDYEVPPPLTSRTSRRHSQHWQQQHRDRSRPPSSHTRTPRDRDIVTVSNCSLAGGHPVTQANCLFQVQFTSTKALLAPQGVDAQERRMGHW